MWPARFPDRDVDDDFSGPETQIDTVDLRRVVAEVLGRPRRRRFELVGRRRHVQLVPVPVEQAQQHHLGAQAEDRAAPQVVVNGVLVAERQVAQVEAAPGAAAAVFDRHRDLDHPPRPEPLLVQELRLRAPAAVRVGEHGDDDLVLGERLLGEQRPRQVELAPGPGVVDAERPHVTEDREDLRLAQFGPERRQQQQGQDRAQTGKRFQVTLSVAAPQDARGCSLSPFRLAGSGRA